MYTTVDLKKLKKKSKLKIFMTLCFPINSLSAKHNNVEVAQLCKNFRSFDDVTLYDLNTTMAT